MADKSRVRPLKAWGPILGCLAAAGGWQLVAHNGGAGWVQALGDVLGPTLLVGLLAPAIILARTRLGVTVAPGDAIAGAPCNVSVTATSRVRVRPVLPEGPESFVGPGRDIVVLEPQTRGVHDHLVAEISTAAPFGLLWWTRRVRLSLPVELVVAPRTGQPFDVARAPDSGRGDGAVLARADVGELHAVRDYRPGDRRRSVHWPATAHRGSLAVKEMDGPMAEPVVVTAWLPADAEEAEHVAERVVGTLVMLLTRGTPVLLATMETSGPRTEEVGDRRQAGRGLARAVPGGGTVEGIALGSLAAAESESATDADEGPVSILERIKRANRPGPAEDSVPLRMASGAAVLIGIAAVQSQGEVSLAVAVAAYALLVVGMLISYRTRHKPPVWAKVLLAAGAIAAFAWFFHQLSGQPVADVSTVEDPLAELFIAIQVLHAFDVPARRDLAFSLGGSATLMAVGAAQATDMSFGFYALAWILVGAWGLIAMGASAAGGRAVAARTGMGVLAATLLLTVCMLLVLPAPRVGGAINFPLDPGANVSLTSPLGLAGDGGSASEPARPGSASGPSRVGGYNGFATRLDTALRGALGNTVVMRVRAQRPSYWVGETFDKWDGQNWVLSPSVPKIVDRGSPFVVPVVNDQTALGAGDLQTFYVVQSTPNLIFHADDAVNVWFPARAIFERTDGTLISPIALGRGAIYTVRSYVTQTDPAQLRTVDALPATAGLSAQDVARYTELPHSYPRVSALSHQVTAPYVGTYDKVEALIGWIGAHTKYSTDIPPLAPGQDTVDQFLFGSRVGFCEQISTALAVMLRSQGIPARETVGFVPGHYNPITDLYDVDASDAHAWVEVWFPGYGWQSFDPTAVVPLANPNPGVTFFHQAGRALHDIPVVPTGIVVLVGATGWTAELWRRRRPANWMELAARRMESAGRRAGRPRRISETLVEYAAVLDGGHAGNGASWHEVARIIEAAAYGHDERAADRSRALALSKSLGVEGYGRGAWP